MLDEQEFLAKAKELARTMVWDFYRQRVAFAELLARLDKESFSWIGAGGQEFFPEREAAEAYFGQQWQEHAVPLFDIAEETYVPQPLTPAFCLVVAEYLLRTDPATVQEKGVIAERQRATFVCRQDEAGTVSVCHIHVSNPWAPMHRGEFWPQAFGRETYEYLTKLASEQKYRRLDMLNEQQKKIAFLLAEGLSYEEVGAALDITKYTVRYHVDRMCRLLKVKNRAQLLALLSQQGRRP